MPIYEYRCEFCGQEHEVLQKVSEPPLTDCPSCHKPGLQKLLTAAGFHLKGSGWYATDFKGGAKKTEEKPKTEETSKTETKTDPKPDSKTETKSAAAACTD